MMKTLCGYIFLVGLATITHIQGGQISDILNRLDSLHSNHHVLTERLQQLDINHGKVKDKLNISLKVKDTMDRVKDTQDVSEKVKVNSKVKDKLGHKINDTTKVKGTIKVKDTQVYNNSAGVNTQAYFTAYVSTGREYYGAGVTVLFDSVVTNPGGFYNPAIGVFTCPETAYYSFSTTVNPAGTFDRIGVEIQMAGLSLVGTYADEYSPASVSVVTRCEQFQQVSVRVTHDDCDIYGTSDERWSTFTGALLFTSTPI